MMTLTNSPCFVLSNPITLRHQLLEKNAACARRGRPAKCSISERAPVECLSIPVPSTMSLLKLTGVGMAAATIMFYSGSPSKVEAVSGGGKDYASQNHSGETFHGDFSEKDFSGGLFRNCDFAGAILKSARLFKAELREADLSKTDLSYATIEAAILRDTVFDDAVMIGTYISDSILDAASIKGADFSDALISPASVVSKLCQRPDADGVNSVTGVSTRESLMCPD